MGATKRWIKHATFACLPLFAVFAHNHAAAWTNANIESINVIVDGESFESVELTIGLRVNAGWVETLELPNFGACTKSAVAFVSASDGARYPAKLSDDCSSISFRKSPRKGLYRGVIQFQRSPNAARQLDFPGWSSPIDSLVTVIRGVDLPGHSFDESVVIERSSSSVRFERFSLPPHSPLTLSWADQADDFGAPTAMAAAAGRTKRLIASKDQRVPVAAMINRATLTDIPSLLALFFGWLFVFFIRKNGIQVKVIRTLALLAAAIAMLTHHVNFEWSGLLVFTLAVYPFSTRDSEPTLRHPFVATSIVALIAIGTSTIAFSIIPWLFVAILLLATPTKKTPEPKLDGPSMLQPS